MSHIIKAKLIIPEHLRHTFLQAAELLGGRVTTYTEAREVALGWGNRVTAVATIQLPNWQEQIAITPAGEIVRDDWETQQDKKKAEQFAQLTQGYVALCAQQYAQQHYADVSHQYDASGNLVIAITNLA